MPPLILHNVPDDELYVGDDGVQRPYAMVFPGIESGASTRTRRAVPESGSFGKSRRRSRSKTSGTPARREDPTLQAADAVFARYFAEKASSQSQSPSRKATLPSSASQPNLSNAAANTDSSASVPRFIHNEPTEVILRGFEESQDYAAIRHYETLAGRICEDYSRDPPISQRRYKSDLRDQTALRSKPLTLEEKAKVKVYAGGKHWIKITFESAEAAEAAIYSSPQVVLGHLIYAEPYNQHPPTITDAIPASGVRASQTNGSNSSLFTARPEPRASTLPRSSTTPSMSQIGRGSNTRDQFSPSDSLTSSNTIESTTASDVTAIGSSSRSLQESTSAQPQANESQFCRRIPTAKKATLLPASQALMPQQTLTQRVTSYIPLVSWLSKDVIGSTVPRTEAGEFDWAMASFYWRLCWFLDFWFRWMNGELVGAEKDE